MIIVEGVDNTGKSSLIQTLVNVFPMLKVGRFDKAPEAQEHDYRNYVWGTLAQSPKQTAFKIFDRFLFSELVYGPILRGKVRLLDSECLAALSMIKFHKPLIIYCKRPMDKVLETFGEREQLSGVKENLTSLMSAYDSYLLSHTFHPYVITYDLENPKDLVRVVGRVADYIRKYFDLHWEDGEE